MLRVTRGIMVIWVLDGVYATLIGTSVLLARKSFTVPVVTVIASSGSDAPSIMGWREDRADGIGVDRRRAGNQSARIIGRAAPEEGGSSSVTAGVDRHRYLRDAAGHAAAAHPEGKGINAAHGMLNHGSAIAVNVQLAPPSGLGSTAGKGDELGSSADRVQGALRNADTASVLN